jgi:hypothetical protein
MWIKLGNEYLNLDQVIRVRFNKAFRGGQEEWAAEVETLVKGEVQAFTRYRGAEALALQQVLATRTAESEGAVAVHAPEAVQAPHATQALANTVPDVHLP